MIKAVLFDFGQTLVDSSRGFRTAEKESQRKLHSMLQGVSWEVFIEHYRIARRAFQDRSDFSRLALWQAVIKDLQGNPDSAALENWEREYWSTVRNNTAVFPETSSVLKVLSSTYRIGLITNTQGETHENRHRSAAFPEIMSLFETTVVAGDGGIAAKPDPQPFQVSLERLGVNAGEAVYVGDDYRNDVSGAADAGMHPIWLQHHLVKRNWPTVNTTVPVIQSLSELLQPEELFPG